MILAFRYKLSQEIPELPRSYKDEKLGDTSHVLTEVLGNAVQQLDLLFRPKPMKPPILTNCIR